MGRIVFANATLLDADAGVSRPGYSVLVDGERIAGLEAGPIDADGARRIDLAGRTLMPGLIDAHVHVAITTMNLAAMEQRPASLGERRDPGPRGRARGDRGRCARDVLVVDGDPLADVTLLAHPQRSIALILKAGEIVLDALS